MSDDLNTARQTVADVAKALGRSGLVIHTSGNVSVRLEDGRIAITPNGVPYEQLELDDIAIVGTDGAQQFGSRPPSSETLLHLACYEARDEERAIVHTHSTFATILSTLVDEVPPIHYQMADLGWPIVVGEYATFGSQQLAKHTVEALGDRNVALMKNHGMIALAAGADHALRRATTAEWICEVFYRARLLGRPSLIESDELDIVLSKQRQLAASRAEAGNSGDPERLGFADNYSEKGRI